MKEIDNYNLLLPFIQTKDSGFRHLLQIIDRSRGNDSRASLFKDVVYREKLEKRYEEYKAIARATDSRIYLNLNYFDNKKAMLKCSIRLTETFICNEKNSNVLNVLYSELGKMSETRIYLVDLDDVSLADKLRGEIGDALILENPSVSGIHFHVKPSPFLQDFVKRGINFHRNNPTILYYLKA